MFDIIIKNGLIADGSGQKPYPGDLAISGDRIAAIGDFSAAQSAVTIDADGLVVAPGFIDIHTHSDWTLLADPRAESHIRQGVTTAVIGQCGTSLAPVNNAAAAERFALAYHPSIDATWQSFAEYLERLDKAKPAINVVPCVGHGTIRSLVLKMAPRPATVDEIRQMARLVEESFEQGAFGITTGLEYPPGKDSGIDELVALCRVAARYRGFHGSHVRNRDVFYDLAFSEVIAISRESGVRLQISHINPKYGRPASAMAHTLEMIGWAREEGIAVGMDMMPGRWNHTALAAIVLPTWVFQLSLPEIGELLSTPEGRQKLKTDFRSMWPLVNEGRWDRIRIFTAEVNQSVIGMTLAEIGRERGLHPHDAAFDLLVEEGNHAVRMVCVGDSFIEEDSLLVLQDANCSVTSDAVGIGLDGPYAGQRFSPMAYNWVPHFLQEYIQKKKVLSLEEGIRRLTSLPAAQAGLTDRGIIRPGAPADIVILDAETVADRSSIREPNLYPQGIAHVLVNGVPAMANGKRLPDRAGSVLRRGC
ncbi:MAG: amidohydrolase family protein [bacterium]